ncbi:hypothetical protein NKH18_12085 [Streptomyces sp. M10(2022)]
MLVLDSLDEVPAEHLRAMIEELVFPLSRMSPVLLGSRDRAFRSRIEEDGQGDETLPDALARLTGTGSPLWIWSGSRTRRRTSVSTCSAGARQPVSRRTGRGRRATRLPRVPRRWVAGSCSRGWWRARCWQGPCRRGRAVAGRPARLHRGRVRGGPAGGTGAGPGGRHRTAVRRAGSADCAGVDGRARDARRGRVGGGRRSAGRR